MGEIGLDTMVKISRHAASEPPSKLGLRAGQRIKLRFLIRAAAVKSANDASTALAEAIEGSEAAFARRMNRTAGLMGMTRTTFKNAHGLTEEGHLSTARDMTILGRHLFYDFPEYYNSFPASRPMPACARSTQHQPQAAAQLSRRRRHQDGLHPRGGLQPDRLGRTRAGADHRHGVRRTIGRVAKPADHGTSRHGLRPCAGERDASARRALPPMTTMDPVDTDDPASGARGAQSAPRSAPPRPRRRPN
jgi:hypothetical protein